MKFRLKVLGSLVVLALLTETCMSAANLRKSFGTSPDVIVVYPRSKAANSNSGDSAFPDSERVNKIIAQHVADAFKADYGAAQIRVVPTDSFSLLNAELPPGTELNQSNLIIKLGISYNDAPSQNSDAVFHKVWVWLRFYHPNGEAEGSAPQALTNPQSNEALAKTEGGKLTINNDYLSDILTTAKATFHNYKTKVEE